MFPPATSGRLLFLAFAFFFFFFFFFTRSGALTLTITPDQGSNIRIWSLQVKGCQVCAVSGRQRHCSSSLLLKDSRRATAVEFTCSAPQDQFNVEITQDIECSVKSCSGHIVQTDSGSLPLLAFDRKFTWNLQAAPTALRLDFGRNEGLRQVNGSVDCPDHHSYSLVVSEGREDVVVGRFCRRGPISSAQILNRGRFTLEVPGQRRVQGSQFNVSVGQEIKSLAKVTVTLPRGRSSVQLFSPNYPGSFPDDDVMEWFFQLPEQHSAHVQLLKSTRPQCLKKNVALEYRSNARGAVVLSITDPQPQQNHGNFSLMLRNCEMDRRRSGSPGLSLSFEVSSSSQKTQASCRVDASKLEGSSLHIKKLKPESSNCQMKINSASKDEITVASGAELLFQDCLSADVQVTASRTVECRQLNNCPRTPIRLTLPLLPPCIPATLTSATFSVTPPPRGTVELTPPSSSGPLRQALPGQTCSTGSLVVEVAEEDGVLGRFCPGGAIMRMQVHTAAVRLTVTRTAGRALQGPVMSVLMKEEIAERFMFFVSPKRDSPMLLATPGWPGAMGSYSTVSWLVSVPPGTEAWLTFTNLSQPKCSTRHTSVRVQRLDRREEDYSRREDEPAEDVVVSHSFYLNMSNCMPEKGHFSVVTKLTLKKSSNLLLTIILSVVAALVLILVVVLAVVCVVIRRKKKKLSHQVSIYNPNGSVFLPGTRTDAEDEHEYASIEDTLVYTHLLRKGREVGVYGDFDTYRPFTGATDSQKPLVAGGSAQRSEGQQLQNAPPLPSRPLSHSRDQLPDQNEGLGLVDNVIYRSREEHRGSLGPRLDPEGGN